MRTMRVLLLTASLAIAGSAWGAKISDVRGTKHNLSVSGPGTVRATSESQVCVFCHTPHAATPGATPLWNRRMSSQTYTVYTSSSLDANAIQGALDQPGGASKLCLSCHDGTLAIGNVNVLGGQGKVPTSDPLTQGTIVINLGGTAPDGTMPDGEVPGTGFTRDLGVNLTNDHPISVTYTNALAQRDGELRALNASQRDTQTGGTLIGVRTPGYKPALPMEPTGTGGLGQVQCSACHDAHLRETDPARGNQKFLRLNRFQEATPTAAFNRDNDIFCIGCHDKNRESVGITAGSWSYSAHASPAVANETYTTAAANLREFPTTTAFPVWRAACLNCHDTHTVPGARRLGREGTDGPTAANGAKQGGNSAIEETCYQCHTTAAQSALNTNTTVPNIETEFGLTRHMPITSTQQAAGSEVHDIGPGSPGFAEPGIDCSNATNRCGADFIEPRTLLGDNANLINRHAECTDCHNPHRVIKYQVGLPGALAALTFNDTGLSKAGTHRHEDAAGYIHSNAISGVLRGSWGVEPQYPDESFHSMPSNFVVKRGDPGTSADTSAGAAHVTREYQVCLKCHSNYGYLDDNVYPSGNTRPELGGPGLTPQNANGHNNFTRYTNQAKEFQAPSAHAVTTGSVSRGFLGGAGPLPAGNAATNNNNHRSWHPVMAPTGRVNRPGAFLTPWNNTGAGGQAGRLGVQTMYCSDCHGSNTNAGTVMPVGNSNTNENGNPWGPHGSTQNFLLKGQWDNAIGEGNANTICFKCHSQAAYSGGGGTGWNTDKGDGHDVHNNRIDTPLRCIFCHVAVPHGWKNRSLLVNLNDVGPEAGLPRGTSVTFANNVGYTNGPYYRRAFARITSFPSGQWTDTNCNGGRDGMKTNCETPG